jgi:hypothetical protein
LQILVFNSEFLIHPIQFRILDIHLIRKFLPCQSRQKPANPSPPSGLHADYVEGSVNCAGAVMRPGTGSGSHLLFCGRRLGVEAIPGSDGRCGPNNGPQCADCQAGPLPPPAKEDASGSGMMSLPDALLPLLPFSEPRAHAAAPLESLTALLTLVHGLPKTFMLRGLPPAVADGIFNELEQVCPTTHI